MRWAARAGAWPAWRLGHGEQPCCRGCKSALYCAAAASGRCCCLRLYYGLTLGRLRQPPSSAACARPRRLLLADRPLRALTLGATADAVACRCCRNAPHSAAGSSWCAVSQRSACSKCLRAPRRTRLFAKKKKIWETIPASSSGHHLLAHSGPWFFGSGGGSAARAGHAGPSLRCLQLGGTRAARRAHACMASGHCNRGGALPPRKIRSQQGKSSYDYERRTMLCVAAQRRGAGRRCHCAPPLGRTCPCRRPEVPCRSRAAKPAAPAASRASPSPWRRPRAAQPSAQRHHPPCAPSRRAAERLPRYRPSEGCCYELLYNESAWVGSHAARGPSRRIQRVDRRACAALCKFKVFQQSPFRGRELSVLRACCSCLTRVVVIQMNAPSNASVAGVGAKHKNRFGLHILLSLSEAGEAGQTSPPPGASGGHVCAWPHLEREGFSLRCQWLWRDGQGQSWCNGAPAARAPLRLHCCTCACASQQGPFARTAAKSLLPSCTLSPCTTPTQSRSSGICSHLLGRASRRHGAGCDVGGAYARFPGQRILS